MRVIVGKNLAAALRAGLVPSQDNQIIARMTLFRCKPHYPPAHGGKACQGR